MSEEKWKLPGELAPYCKRPVSIYPAMLRVTGGLLEAAYLQQAIFWSTLPVAKARGGWWAHDIVCIRAHIGAGGDGQKRVRERLVNAGFLEQRRTLGNRVATRVVLPAIVQALKKDAERESARLEKENKKRDKEGKQPKKSNCGCLDDGMMVRVAECAWRLGLRVQKPDSGNTRPSTDGEVEQAVTRNQNRAEPGTGSWDERDPESGQDPVSILSETTAETAPEPTPNTTPEGGSSSCTRDDDDAPIGQEKGWRWLIERLAVRLAQPGEGIRSPQRYISRAIVEEGLDPVFATDPVWIGWIMARAKAEADEYCQGGSQSNRPSFTRGDREILEGGGLSPDRKAFLRRMSSAEKDGGNA